MFRIIMVIVLLISLSGCSKKCKQSDCVDGGCEVTECPKRAANVATAPVVDPVVDPVVEPAVDPVVDPAAVTVNADPVIEPVVDPTPRETRVVSSEPVRVESAAVVVQSVATDPAVVSRVEPDAVIRAEPVVGDIDPLDAISPQETVVAPAAAVTPLFVLDFSRLNLPSNVEAGLVSQGFTVKHQNGRMLLSMRDGKLRVESRSGSLAWAGKELSQIARASKLRVTWGAERFPDNANWNEGTMREAVGILMMFGNEKFGGGNFFLPKLPYMIGFSLSNRCQTGRLYQGSYYKDTARYMPVNCEASVNQEIVTEIDLKDTFRKAFQKDMPNPVGMSLSIDSRDSSGPTAAWISKIEFLP